VRCQHAPSFWREKRAFSLDFLVENLFAPSFATSRGTGLGHANPLLLGASTRVLGRFPTFQVPPGVGREAARLAMIELSGAGNCLWNPGNLPGKPSFRSEDTVKNSRGAQGIGLAPPAADRISPFFDDRAVRPPLPMRLPP